MRLEEQQVEEPQLDSSVSSATACRTPCWDFFLSPSICLPFPLHTHTFLLFSCFSSSCDSSLHPSLCFIIYIYFSFTTHFYPRFFFSNQKTKTNIKESEPGLVPHGARWAPYYTLSWAHRYMERTFMHYTSSPILTQSQFLRSPHRTSESSPVGLQRQSLRWAFQVDRQ